MAHLLTDHDKYHLHALLGLAVLLHFVLRWGMLLAYGDAFGNAGMFCFNVLTVLLHAALPLSALSLPIPQARNFSAPMIWPEFRLHSLAFASRHVLSTITALALPAHREMQLVFTHLALFSASLVSDKYGDQQKRTTNAMPYASRVGPSEAQHTKNMYARAQFLATAFALVGCPSLSFVPVLGIQSAPLLMTLVRKGKIPASTYHRVYAWTLLLPLPATMCIVHHNPHLLKDILLAFATGALAQFARTKIRLGKHACWLVAPTISYLAEPHLAATVACLDPVTSASAFHLAIIAGLARNLYLIPHIIGVAR